ncbi:MAG: hypothetical protein JO316_02155 [Abitibacteriaceae bacterium]|nr:hypothetical protein [Abditibacteriaceae bacterium]MBV9864131.1 hypothetical protein [Abditibacteriaceae bacterium]
MTASDPIICFGQQPCGFFPKRFLVAKILTARRLQSELGGEIVFFYHDSDHDPRETQTVLRRQDTGLPVQMNFAFANKIQRKFSPLYLKRVLAEWHTKTLRRLPAYVAPCWVDAFQSIDVTAEGMNSADFCLEMYRRMGLLDGIRVVRSSDPALRQAACEVSDFFVDVPYESEVVRARYIEGELKLHEGGDSYLTLPPTSFTKAQISPTRDTRLKWMQSGVHCTHYVSGAGEQAYMCKEDAPEIAYVQRDVIEQSHEAYIEFPA